MIKSELHLEYMYLNQKTFYKILQMKIVFFFFLILLPGNNQMI